MKPPTMSDKSSEWIRSANQPSSVSIPKLAVAQNDRRNYKNISIYITELPTTPSKLRDKYHRATATKLAEIEACYEYNDKHSLFTSGGLSAQTQTSFRNPSNYSAPSPAIDRFETTLKEMAAATLDRDFKDELGAIEQWFRVLSEAERTAALYALFQQTTQVQIHFFILALQQC